MAVAAVRADGTDTRPSGWQAPATAADESDRVSADYSEKFLWNSERQHQGYFTCLRTPWPRCRRTRFAPSAPYQAIGEHQA